MTQKLFLQIYSQKNPNNPIKQILFPVCYFYKNPLFTEVIQVTNFTTAFPLKLDSILPFLHVFFSSLH